MNRILEQFKHGITTDGYRDTEAGVLPSDWECAKISEIFDPITQVAGTDQYETVSVSAGVGFVNQALKFGKELSGKQYEKYTVLHRGDFSYNKGNSGKYPQGCIYRPKDRESAAVPNVFESFHIKSGSPDYYDQLFTIGYLNHQLYRLINHGVRDDGLLNLTQEDFYSCMLPVPPVSEQEKIAEILATQDIVIELCERKIEQLKKQKKVFLQKMFPKFGANVPEWRFPGFTEAWEQRKLGDVVGVYDGTHQTPDYKDQGVMFVSVENIQTLTSDKYISEEDYEKNYSVIPEVGDVLMTRIGDIGTANIVKSPEPLAYYVSLALLKNAELNAEYLKANISAPAFQNELWLRTLHTAYPKKINKDEIGKCMISIAPQKGEQEQIGAFFENLDTLITLHQRKCDEEKQKKKALMQLLLTGIVRIK